MAEIAQPGWTRLRTSQGRYEYQFQGRVPCVRGGRYEAAADYQFLVMDEEGWLFKIPVRVSAEAEAALRSAPQSPQGTDPILRAAEAQLRTGLETHRPKSNTPYFELDSQFAVDAARALQLASETNPN